MSGQNLARQDNASAPPDRHLKKEDFHRLPSAIK